MSPKQRATTAKKIIDMFIAEYEDRHGEPYLVNFPMIKSVEKIAQYYSLTQVNQAMLFYFEAKKTHSIWEFIDGLDSWLNSSIADIKAQERLRGLIEKTKGKLNEHRGSVNNQDHREQGHLEGHQYEGIEMPEDL